MDVASSGEGVWLGGTLHSLKSVADCSKSSLISFSFQYSRESRRQHPKEQRPPACGK